MLSLLSDAQLLQLLDEDAPYGDLTSRHVALVGGKIHMVFKARYAMSLCGLEEAARLLQLLQCEVSLLQGRGDGVVAGTPLLQARGPAENLLLGWKAGQTLVEWASGISSAATAIVQAARSVQPDVVVACTRKVVPGTRRLSLAAVVAGGAQIHRTGLSDTLLLFPEHRQLARAPQGALERMVQDLRRHCPEKAVVVEVTSPEEALQAAKAGADVIQTEKFSLDALQQTAEGLKAFPQVRLAAAGGINAANAADHVLAGARILVTSAPYTAPPKDVAVSFTP